MVRFKIRDRNILFLCRDNACLSFMAEAIARQLLPPQTQVFSAGLKPEKIDSKTVQMLGEIGIDVSTQEAKGLDVIPTDNIDLIIMLGELKKTLPPFSPNTRLTTWALADPRQEPGSDEAFRRSRDEINNRVAGLFLDYWRNVA